MACGALVHGGRPFRRTRPGTSSAEGAGSQFDPDLVEAFLHIQPRVGARAASGWDQPHLRGLFDRLSPRPWQVLALCAAGVDVPRCSALLGLDRDQIRNYRGRLRRQLRLPERQDLGDAVREHLYPLVAPAVAITPLLSG